MGPKRNYGKPQARPPPPPPPSAAADCLRQRANRDTLALSPRSHIRTQWEEGLATNRRRWAALAALARWDRQQRKEVQQLDVELTRLLLVLFDDEDLRGWTRLAYKVEERNDDLFPSLSTAAFFSRQSPSPLAAHDLRALVLDSNPYVLDLLKTYQRDAKLGHVIEASLHFRTTWQRGKGNQIDGEATGAGTRRDLFGHDVGPWSNLRPSTSTLQRLELYQTEGLLAASLFAAFKVILPSHLSFLEQTTSLYDLTPIVGTSVPTTLGYSRRYEATAHLERRNDAGFTTASCAGSWATPALFRMQAGPKSSGGVFTAIPCLACHRGDTTSTSKALETSSL
ncbi:hypothetical protein JCM1840_005065 [Sporobolomyces johnsonii]